MLIHMDDIKHIKNLLEFQGKQLEQLIWQVKGNEGLQIKGIVPTLEEVSTKVNDINVWREGMWKIDLKKLMTAKSILGTLRFIAVIVGVGGGSFGVHQLFKLLFIKG